MLKIPKKGDLWEFLKDSSIILLSCPVTLPLLSKWLLIVPSGGPTWQRGGVPKERRFPRPVIHNHHESVQAKCYFTSNFAYKVLMCEQKCQTLSLWNRCACIITNWRHSSWSLTIKGDFFYSMFFEEEHTCCPPCCEIPQSQVLSSFLCWLMSNLSETITSFLLFFTVS